MAIQTINLGTAPSGAGGDTFRSTGTKVNENFTNNTHAASRYVGTSAGNVMEVGAFGLGTTSGSNTYYSNINISNIPAGCYSVAPTATGSPGANGGGNLFAFGGANYQVQFHKQNIQNQLSIRFGTGLDSFTGWGSILISGINTTTDSNGFIKAASPVAQLFADKIAANEEALEQEPLFEKVDIGHYLVKNTEGFSDDGWYIEMPKDANGNVLVAVQYQQLEDNTIEVKTFTKKFDEETGDIVPNLEKPRDIPAGRWIDIRLKELPKPEVETTITPPEFQPTNLSQAVAEALKNDAEQ